MSQAVSRTEALEQALAYRFATPALLRQALTHRSYAADHNERLEFLGDSLLNMVIAMALFERFPQAREGELSRLRARLVCQDSLHGVALELSLGEYLLLGEGEVRNGGQQRPSMLADAVEAIFGAIYRDGGFEPARRTIERLLATALAAASLDSLKDPKTALQEELQGRRLPLPRYELCATHGAAHAQEFEVACVVEALSLRSTGRGSSRRIAEQQAAAAVLAEIKA
ncbi:MAG: ribonuclease III [Candidatus Dactylopiibacterium carminicum]|uniref:Ribonuclease 3 n=1 Tax=Candidatus Dactylopiibacterium carminicum TaxID=857335 RepID=A0A272ESS3_9RHOO|nr:ribonuclease III [Candidatus Dactylopiibacterium carminicum]KAF7599084.1 ribonuclease III [Candidatus Dactylopiibacterium carminicum]PAS93155.1 MAG: ribonuclease III [Candidatus Dactylopiibacterium carminicum]PAS96873.1 MAG: ribonuclease III [Candidatus Dactylopiibacterium carminicum]PAS99098.1 MAG: ribonuclease III [Candidatus Dactylopiibacterium carminicum]